MIPSPAPFVHLEQPWTPTSSRPCRPAPARTTPRSGASPVRSGPTTSNRPCWRRSRSAASRSRGRPAPAAAPGRPSVPSACSPPAPGSPGSAIRGRPRSGCAPAGPLSRSPPPRSPSASASAEPAALLAWFPAVCAVYALVFTAGAAAAFTTAALGVLVLLASDSAAGAPSETAFAACAAALLAVSLAARTLRAALGAFGRRPARPRASGTGPRAGVRARGRRRRSRSPVSHRCSGTLRRPARPGRSAGRTRPGPLPCRRRRRRHRAPRPHAPRRRHARLVRRAGLARVRCSTRSLDAPAPGCRRGTSSRGCRTGVWPCCSRAWTPAPASSSRAAWPRCSPSPWTPGSQVVSLPATAALALADGPHDVPEALLPGPRSRPRSRTPASSSARRRRASPSRTRSPRELWPALAAGEVGIALQPIVAPRHAAPPRPPDRRRGARAVDAGGRHQRPAGPLRARRPSLRAGRPARRDRPRPGAGRGAGAARGRGRDARPRRQPRPGAAHGPGTPPRTCWVHWTPPAWSPPRSPWRSLRPPPSTTPPPRGPPSPPCGTPGSGWRWTTSARPDSRSRHCVTCRSPASSSTGR